MTVANISLRNQCFHRFNIPRKLKRLLILVVGLILIGLYFLNYNLIGYDSFRTRTAPSLVSSFCPHSFSFCKNLRVLEGHNQKCRIPKLDPFDESILRFLKTERNYSKQEGWLCDEFPILFNSTLESEIVPAVDLHGFRNHSIVSCCYKVIQRKENEDKPDEYFKYSDECYELSLTKVTKIPDEHEFIAIFCRDAKNKSEVYDMHAFISVNESEMPVNSEQDQLNILILGVDSVSRMNFIRSMPKTYEYLMKELNAVEMKGYIRNGLNTFECLLPMLTGQTEEEVEMGCGKTLFYDTCPLIWRKFKGYRTLLAEDWASVSMFHHLSRGFRDPPVDHYRHPLGLAVEKEFNEKKEQMIHCEGPRFTIQKLLDYTKKFVHKMNKVRKPFFSFTWTSALTHDEYGPAKFGDPFLLEALEWFHSEGHLRNTLLILMSDHGMAWSEIKSTIQGQYESRLPFIYFVFPEQFKKRYPMAFQNLMGNRERLTSTMDLHETLSDLSDLGQLENETILKRVANLESMEKAGDHRLPIGISQFLPIPLTRSCEDAGINEFYCACGENIVEISVNSSEIKEAALHAVDEINDKLKARYSNCARLELVRITHAHFTMMKDREGNGTTTAAMRPAFLLHYETNPGAGEFEALVMEYKEQPQPEKWKTGLGHIYRLNSYENESYCVDSQYYKNFCYCT